MPERMLAIELQMARYTSDIESEKRTRAQVNSDFHSKLDKISENQERTNRIVWMMLGGLTVLQVVLQFVKH